MSQQAPPPPGAAPAGYQPVAGSPYPQYQPAGDGRVAIPAWAILAFFALAVAAVAAIALLIVLVLTPPPTPPDCIPGQACYPGPLPSGLQPRPSTGPGPTVGPDGAVPRLVVQNVAQNDGLRYTVEYDGSWWTLVDSSGNDLRFTIDEPSYGTPVLRVHGAPASAASPEQLSAELLDQLRAGTIGLTLDHQPQNAIQDPEIGYVRGIQAVYGGTTDSPQGPGKPVLIFMEAATDGNTTIAAALVLVGDFTASSGHGSRTIWYRRLADNVLNSLVWP